MSHNGNGIGDRVRRLRVKAKLTQRQLAGLAGIGVVTLNALERGSRPTRDLTLARVAEALGVEFEDLEEAS